MPAKCDPFHLQSHSLWSDWWVGLGSSFLFLSLSPTGKERQRGERSLEVVLNNEEGCHSFNECLKAACKWSASENKCARMFVCGHVFVWCAAFFLPDSFRHSDIHLSRLWHCAALTKTSKLMQSKNYTITHNRMNFRQSLPYEFCGYSITVFTQSTRKVVNMIRAPFWVI